MRNFVFGIAALLVLGVPLRAQESQPDESQKQVAPTGDAWVKEVADRAQRGSLHESAQIVRGDSGKWQDEPLLVAAPALEKKPATVSLDDWADRLRESNSPLGGNDNIGLLFRTRQLDDNDRVWVERIERSGNRFTIVIHEAVWQGRYFKNFTWYNVLAVNLGQLAPGKYEATCIIEPFAFKQFEGDGRPTDNWPKDERPAETKPVELRLPFTVLAPDPVR